MKGSFIILINKIMLFNEKSVTISKLFNATLRLPQLIVGNVTKQYLVKKIIYIKAKKLLSKF